MLAALILLLAPGCTHTYIYGEARPPSIERGRLLVTSSSGEERFTVRRIGVSAVDSPYHLRPPTADEMREVYAGVMPEGVHTMRVEVDTSDAVWRDWALGGFGIGVSLVLGLVGIAGVVEPGFEGGALTLPVAILFASLAGTEFMLIGAGLGAGLEGGETDMRYRDFAHD